MSNKVLVLTVIVVLAALMFFGWLITLSVQQSARNMAEYEAFWQRHDRLDVPSIEVEKIERLYAEGWRYHSRTGWADTCLVREHKEQP